MTPEQKAKELFDKFNNLHWRMSDTLAKKCAVICGDEIIETNPCNPHPEGYYELTSDRIDAAISYWKSVKEEIQKL